MKNSTTPELVELTHEEMGAVNGGDTAYVPGPIGDDDWWSVAVQVLSDALGLGGGLGHSAPVP